MRFERAYIPVGFAWSSPFARWQGALSEVNSLDMAVDVTRAAFERSSQPKRSPDWSSAGPCRREISSTALLRLLPVSGPLV